MANSPAMGRSNPVTANSPTTDNNRATGNNRTTGNNPITAQQGGYPAQQPGYGPPAGGGGQGWITVDAKFMPLNLLLFILKPKIYIDGQKMPNAEWQPNTYPVTAGVHSVRVTSPYLWEFGEAETQVTVPAGQNIPVEYRSPLAAMFVPGSIGPPPQKYNGLGLMLGLMVAPLVLVVLLCCFSFMFL